MGTLKEERKELNVETLELPTDKRALEKTLMKQILKMLIDKADGGVDALEALLKKQRKRHFKMAEIMRRANNLEPD